MQAFLESLSDSVANSCCCSNLIMIKTLGVNKIVMKSFSTNLSFGVDFKL